MSGREHWAWMVVVEVRRGGEKKKEEEEKEKSANIKSNDPHLTGGEL